jgi:hypothetical protein
MNHTIARLSTPLAALHAAGALQPAQLIILFLSGEVRRPDHGQP